MQCDLYLGGSPKHQQLNISIRTRAQKRKTTQWPEDLEWLDSASADVQPAIDLCLTQFSRPVMILHVRKKNWNPKRRAWTALQKHLALCSVIDVSDDPSPSSEVPLQTLFIQVPAWWSHLIPATQLALAKHMETIDPPEVLDMVNRH